MHPLCGSSALQSGQTCGPMAARANRTYVGPSEPRLCSLRARTFRHPTPESMTDQRLSKRLRSETKDLHTAAERSGVMRTLARGQLTRRGYVALLANLAEIYRALETELS